ACDTTASQTGRRGEPSPATAGSAWPQRHARTPSCRHGVMPRRHLRFLRKESIRSWFLILLSRRPHPSPEQDGSLQIVLVGCLEQFEVLDHGNDGSPPVRHVR